MKNEANRSENEKDKVKETENQVILRYIFAKFVRRVKQWSKHRSRSRMLMFMLMLILMKCDNNGIELSQTKLTVQPSSKSTNR